VAIHHHAIVESPDHVAAGALEEEGEQRVGQAGQAAEKHAYGEPQGMTRMLPVALADAVQMSVEVFHGSHSIPSSLEKVCELH
jgi:hypothetical protein